MPLFTAYEIYNIIILWISAPSLQLVSPTYPYLVFGTIIEYSVHLIYGKMNIIDARGTTTASY